MVVTDHTAYKATKGLWVVIDKVCKHTGLEEPVSKSSPEDSGMCLELVCAQKTVCVCSVYMNNKQRGAEG